MQKWAESRRSDQAFQEYRREYKRRFAWIKAGKLTEEQFAAWHKAAKTRKKDCDREIISLDDFAPEKFEGGCPVKKTSSN